MPLSFVIARYFAYAFAAVATAWLASFMALSAAIDAGFVYEASWGPANAREVAEGLARDGVCGQQDVPTAYRYLILNEDGYVLMTDLEGTRLEDATEMARAALAADPGTVEIEGGGSGLTCAAFPLKGGGACALVSEYLPQWVSRDLAGLLPNPQNLMLVGCAAGSALALALVARRASRVISRKMAPLAEAADVCEQHDFELRRVDQSRHVMIVAADLHLANRPTATGDLRQFAEGFIAETTAFASAQSVPTYLMVLGDMTWDEFWYSNLYSLSNYRTTMQGYPVPIYHTMGNHDNDPYFAGDFAAEAAYRKALGPTYYSFDVGQHGLHQYGRHRRFDGQTQLPLLCDRPATGMAARRSGGLARQVAARGRGDALSGDEQLQRGVRE